ncbi:prostatic acid phosphatase-like isoform X2 [Apostichopus japonicus]|uniref:prostatic acid phosphatase-like isoform X2 n=1 Tax=Stichopus japonicus TaxID=307972 RepID=UPI003AB4F653
MLGLDFSFLCVALIIGSTFSESSLEHVQVLFRHGDRTPADAYPTDEYQEKDWPQGFGQLTQVGMKQHYQLGKFLQQKYVEDTELLDANYSRYEISIWSTDVDRTLMSAAVDLSGFFPPQGHQVWDKDIPWQPIPVHTMPVAEDFYLSFSANCPTYTQLQEESLNDDDYVALSKKYAGFLKKLNTDSGFNGSITINNIYKVSDPLKIEKLKNLTLPDWTKEDKFWETLDFLSTYAMGQMFDSTAKSRLRGGPLLGQMINNMRDFMNTSQTGHKLKFHMYSAHDVTVTSLLTALQIFNDLQPPYASAVGVELWKNKDTKKSPFSVRIWYRNNTQQVDPYNLILPGCELDCPFDKFVELTKDRTLAEGDIRKACGLVVTDNYWIPTIVGIALGVMIVVFVVIYLITINRKLKAGHKLLEEVIEDPW